MTRWSLFLQTLSLLLHHFLGLYSVLVIFLIALMALVPVVSAAVTNETGTVSGVNPDLVRIDPFTVDYPVDGGFPAACNTMGSPVTFYIDLDDIDPRASGVACVAVAPPPSDQDNNDDDGDNDDEDDGDADDDD